MLSIFLRIFSIVIVCIPFLAYAEDEWYIGKTLWLDFYSTIDDGNYTLVKSLVNRELQKTPTLGEFWAGCPGIQYIATNRTSTAILEYATLSQALSQSQKLKDEKRGVTIDEYQSLMLCLQSRYSGLVQSKQSESDTLEKLGSIGLYTDGNTSNSEYDIIADIDKINSVLFSEALKYNGAVNRTPQSLKEALFIGPIPISTAQKKNWPIIVPVGVPKNRNSNGALISNGSDTLGSIIGESCRENNIGIPLDSLVDRAFVDELTLIMRRPQKDDFFQKASPIIWSSEGSNTEKILTNVSDFYNAQPSCSGLFCIDMRFISAENQNVLGSSRSLSLESIIDKHSAILEPIAATNLACQRMTMNMGESPLDKLRLMKSLKGWKIIYMTKPQAKKKFPSDVTQKSEDEEFKNIERCALASAALPTNPKEVNGPRVIGYSLNSAVTTENIISTRTINTSPQNIDAYGLGASCVDLYMDEWRKAYYDSFMSDITQIEAFTRSMMQVMTNVVNIWTNMDSKPTWCQ